MTLVEYVKFREDILTVIEKEILGTVIIGGGPAWTPTWYNYYSTNGSTSLSASISERDIYTFQNDLLSNDRNFWEDFSKKCLTSGKTVVE